MIHLDNDAVADLLTMADAIDALRIGFDELAAGYAAHVPRLELWSPTPSDDSYHCLGAMSGTSKHFGVSAMRIKSDVLSWPEGRRQEKYAVEPGTYCGFLLVFSTATGAPIALINDGVLQRTRVGASGGVAIDHLSHPDASTVGILGAGDMARVHVEAISLVRPLERVRVFSPNPASRHAYATEMTDRLGVPVDPVASAADALNGAHIVVSATNSMSPTIPTEALPPGATVLCITRREVGPDLVAAADSVLQLGAHSIMPEAAVPDMEWPQSAAGGFVAGSPAERERLPWKHRAESRTFPSLIDVLRGSASGRTANDETIVFLNIGNQGLQFAATAGRLLERARERGVGASIARDAFLQNVRD